jgi:hypothetical protein
LVNISPGSDHNVAFVKDRPFLPLSKYPMSFSFEWPRFSEQFHEDAIKMLNNALNKGPKPPVIADKIEVVELEMGSQARVCSPASRLTPTLTSSHLAPRARNS